VVRHRWLTGSAIDRIQRPDDDHPTEFHSNITTRANAGVAAHSMLGDPFVALADDGTGR